MKTFKERIIDQIGQSWYNQIGEEFYKPYMRKISNKVRVDRARYLVHPESDQVFRALKCTPYDKVKVVIIGQDPYPHEHANGLAFSTEESMEPIPPSLKNIFKELEEDVKFQLYHNPDLTRWAKQGVLLLNRTLTTVHGKPNSHQKIGWKRFTYKVVHQVCQKQKSVVFILWGNKAGEFLHEIPEPHKVIYSAHPSPLSAYRGFFGSKPFTRTNEHLIQTGQEPIDWLSDEVEQN